MAAPNHPSFFGYTTTLKEASWAQTNLGYITPSYALSNHHIPSQKAFQRLGRFPRKINSLIDVCFPIVIYRFIFEFLERHDQIQQNKIITSFYIIFYQPHCVIHLERTTNARWNKLVLVHFCHIIFSKDIHEIRILSRFISF